MRHPGPVSRATWLAGTGTCGVDPGFSESDRRTIVRVWRYAAEGRIGLASNGWGTCPFSGACAGPPPSGRPPAWPPSPPPRAERYLPS